MLPGPELTSVRFEDTDNDDRVSTGDRVVVGFATDLEPLGQQAMDPGQTFQLSVAGDSFGKNATLTPGASANEVAVVLGDGARLYVSGQFNVAIRAEGSASGLNLSTGVTGLRGLNADVVQPAKSDMDVSGNLRAQFVPAGSLNVPRGQHAAVKLDDGRVLIVGGVAGGRKNDLISESELYDPLTQTFTKVSDLSGDKGYMKRGRVKVRMFQSSAVKLPSGKVLICGGYGVEKRRFFGLGSAKVDTLESAFEFDPQTNKFSRVGDMRYSRHSHTATLMSDGKVLIAGGYNNSFWRKHKSQAPLEVYDPAKRKFVKLGGLFSRTKLRHPRMSHTATPLLGGDAVLLAGGAYYKGGGLFGLIKPKLRMSNNAEAFANGKQTINSGALQAPRLNHAAIALGLNQVLLAGGHVVKGGPVRTVESMDVVSGAWTSVGDLRVPRSGCVMAKHRELALVIGGHTGSTETRTVEAFDRTTNTMSRTSFRLNAPRNGATVTELDDGRVIVIGGLAGGRRSFLSLDGQALASAKEFVRH